MYYVNLFFTYSILGFIFENTLVRLMSDNFESGVLFGPWTPIYGIGVLVVVLIYKWLEKNIKKEYLRSILLFLISAIILSILEIISGKVIEIVFDKVYWNYEHFKYNIGKYASLETAAIWGVFSLFIVYLFKKPIDKIVKRIPKWLSKVFIGLFIIDWIFTLFVK